MSAQQFHMRNLINQTLTKQQRMLGITAPRVNAIAKAAQERANARMANAMEKG